MQSEKKQIHCWEETRRYYMKNKIWFLLYYPDQEIASRFNKSTDKKALIWDFQQKSPERMKRQIFQSLQKLITDDYSNDYRVEKLGHLRYFL